MKLIFACLGWLGFNKGEVAAVMVESGGKGGKLGCLLCISLTSIIWREQNRISFHGKEEFVARFRSRLHIRKGGTES